MNRTTPYTYRSIISVHLLLKTNTEQSFSILHWKISLYNWVLHWTKETSLWSFPSGSTIRLKIIELLKTNRKHSLCSSQFCSANLCWTSSFWQHVATTTYSGRKYSWMLLLKLNLLTVLTLAGILQGHHRRAILMCFDFHQFYMLHNSTSNRFLAQYWSFFFPTGLVTRRRKNKVSAITILKLYKCILRINTSNEHNESCKAWFQWQLKYICSII